MSSIRSLSWAAALQALRADRVQLSSEQRRAHASREGFTKIAAKRANMIARVTPFYSAGKYNRSAIMSAAIEGARARRMVTGEAWNICLSAALKGTWQVAKAARALAVYQAQRAAERALLLNPRLETDQVISPAGEVRLATASPPAAANGTRSKTSFAAQALCGRHGTQLFAHLCTSDSGPCATLSPNPLMRPC
ncbi:hypothetical protein [Methylobacterium oxalidis]|uniref:hypothetical protein n=1 Tax=Methylobacterium oxalidis TaxID=944322 RepID=UPI003315F953